MGKGQRHSKNAGVMGSETLSYAERKALGYGTVRERLGKDSQANFYDCALTLQPAVDPMVTPDGVVYSKEAILENLLAQKKAIKRKLAAWETDQRSQADKAAEKAALEQEAALLAFDRSNHMGISQRTVQGITSALQEEAAKLDEPRGATSVVAIKDNADRMKELKAFWLPNKAPSAAQVIDKPDEHTYCPATGKKLKLKDLVSVRFTRATEEEQSTSDKVLYVDPLTKETFTNASRLVALKPTGDVLLEQTYRKCVKPEGQFNGTKIRDKDVIQLMGGATGYAAHDGERLMTAKHFSNGMGNGRADLRGQNQGPRSLGGLQFWN